MNPTHRGADPMGWSHYRQGIDLETLIQGAIDEFDRDRAEYWKENPQNAFLDIVDSLAEMIFKASEHLVSPDLSSHELFRGDFEGFRKLAESEELRTEVLEKIQIAVAWEYSTGTDQMAERCFELAREVLDSPPRERVLRYLRRLSRCYIAGFLAECVILSRSVVENAVAERFLDSGLPLPATPAGKSSMKTTIEAAHRFGWLSENGRQRALDVWIRGNKAVHDDPEATQDVFGTIRSTLQVLGELYRG